MANKVAINREPLASCAALRYQRIVLKLTGEALANESGVGIDPEVIEAVVGGIKEVKNLGVEIGIVIGGGNFLRGAAVSAKGIDRASADYMGMLATVMNALALQDALEKIGVVTRAMTAIEMRAVAEPYIRRRAIRHLEKGRIIILAAGTGNPYFSTDTAAALRALEIEADVVLKGTKVDGVYTADPLQDQGAEKFSTLSYNDFLSKGLGVLDTTAVSLCMNHGMPIVVFKLTTPGNLRRIVLGEPVGTIIKEG